MSDHDLEGGTAARSPALPAVERTPAATGAATPLARDATANVSCRLGDASCAGAHATTLQRRPAHTSSQHTLLRLQRQYGNQFVSRVVHRADDECPQGRAAPSPPPKGVEKTWGGPAFAHEPAGDLDDVEHSIDQARGGGHGLDSRTRVQMESAFGADFSGVRVHTDARADTLNHALSARAFATGKDVFFRQGEYNPGSSHGRELIAHELTHVVQQNGDVVRPKLSVSEPGDQHEEEADRMARAVVDSEHRQDDDPATHAPQAVSVAGPGPTPGDDEPAGRHA